MNRTLPELRVEIDAVDKDLLTLLNRRAALAGEVGEIKRVEGSPVFRPEREAQVIQSLQAANAGPLKPDSVASIWREIMSACRALEAPQRVAYLGPVGTFSEQAAVRFFGGSIEHVYQWKIRPRAWSRARWICSSPRRCTSWVKPACWCATTCCA
jgi:chorismate mutase/prephenate dehydratase